MDLNINTDIYQAYIYMYMYAGVLQIRYRELVDCWVPSDLTVTLFKSPISLSIYHRQLHNHLCQIYEDPGMFL